MKTAIGINALHHQYGLLVGIVSALLINRACLYVHTLKLYPSHVLKTNTNYSYWRYRNFLISFIHALLTGLGSTACVANTPNLLVDVIDAYSEHGYLLTSFSFGYFLYDTFEMLTHLHYKGTYELILHHVLILFCFLNTIIYKKYVGYNMIALLIELSNISLHFRQLLLLSNYPKVHTLYQINCVANVVLFVTVRGASMVWLWYTLVTNLDRLPMFTKTTVLVSMVGISITTTVLFKRIFVSDFMQQKVTANGLDSESSQLTKSNGPSNDKSKEV